MDYVTVKGKDLQDCLMQMKMKYGPQAHVYEHKVTTEGGVFGTGFLANKIYEITVAIPEKATSKDEMGKKLQELRDLLRKRSNKSQSTQAIMSPREKKESGLVSAGSTRNSNHSLESQNRFSRRSIREIPEFSEWANGMEEEDVDSLETSELVELPIMDDRGLSFVEEMIAQDHSSSIQSNTPPVGVDTEKRESMLSASLEKLNDRLIEEGMSRDYVRELIPELEQHLSPIEKGRYSTVCEKAVEILEDRVRVETDLFAGTKKGKRKVVFIIGPTGSGKTTTLAKLAAKYHLHMGRSVSLYTTDNYRIAAVEQLKRYADTMDLPFYSIKDIKKFREALLRDGSELVLVDTAGYSHKDRETLFKMKEFYDALGENDQLENILVLSTTVSYSNAKEVLSAYEELGYSRVILSKIDETDYLGSFLELADTYSKEFAYFSVGQDVPFDILGAEKKLLAECVVYPEKLKGMTGEVFSKKS